jgi:hypothetical protein
MDVLTYLGVLNAASNRFFALPENSIIIVTHTAIYPLVSFGLLDDFASHMGDSSYPTSFEDFGYTGQNLSVDVCEVSFNLHSLQRSGSSHLLLKTTFNSSHVPRPHNDTFVFRTSFGSHTRTRCAT